MSNDADATGAYDPRPQRRTDTKSTTAGRYVVIDTTTHEQHARGLSKARAETLANEYADHIVARRERPDPHWLQRAGGGRE